MIDVIIYAENNQAKGDLIVSLSAITLGGQPLIIMNSLKKYLLAFTALFFFSLLSAKGADPEQAGTSVGKGPPPATGVRVAEVRRELVSDEITIVGSVESPRISRIGSEVEGIVGSILVEEGDTVKKGRALLRLLNSQLKISLAEMLAQEDEALKNLLELKAGSRPQEIREAEAAMKEAESLWKKASKDHERYKQLYEEKVVDERLLTNSGLEAEAAHGVYLQRKFSYELVLEGTRKEEIAKAEAALQVKKARVSLLRDQLKKTTIYAPFDGVVAEKFVEKGEWVAEGRQVFRVIQTDPVWITLPVPERVAASVKIGTGVTVKIDAFPGRRFEARVVTIIPEAEAGSRTYPIRLALKNPDKLFKMGMTARGIISFGEQREALMVPQDAVTVLRGRKNIVVVGNGKRAKLVQVSVGILKKGFIEVVGDLAQGDLVVTRGGERLRPGMPLKIINPGVVRLYPEANIRNGGKR